ncbi:MarR family winged helix-turn-helix transcriptional regulator [Microlunatus speluncae]|uniref:MarR family winged helix-turn-helix transcriptional regulator n=1 Tax=Microlunatus speluncae TaxID=2594267 RepID=UPI001375D51F|nr:MarR family transcriptional regulator [Microlunatus speluncae]
MSKQTGSTAELIEAIQYAVAEFQHLSDTYDDAAAQLFGVNRTDLRLIGLLSLRGPLTAGALAAGSSLSPAATTTAIERIVRAGHARREQGAEDRRQTVVTLTPRAEELIIRVYTSVAEAGRAQLASYSARELRTIHDFLTRGNVLLAEGERDLRQRESRG